MSNVAIGWILLTLVAIYSQVVHASWLRWSRKRKLPTWLPGIVGVVVMVGPAMFTGWALRRFGIILLGGAS